MDKLIIKVPTYIYTFTILFPILYIVFVFFNLEYKNDIGLTIIKCLSILTTTFWFLSIITFFIKNSKKTNLNNWIYPSFVSSMIFFIVNLFFGLDNQLLIILALVIHLTFTILLTLKIKETFYARTTWFLFIELLSPFIGVLTLPQDIKIWFKEERKTS